MAVTIDGTNGSLFNANGSIGIGGANYGTSGQVLTSAGSGAAPTWTTVGGSGVAKAWVSWNGAGGASINSSFNVSSVTYNGVGDYTVNFTTAMANANYTTVCGGSGNGSGSPGSMLFVNAGTTAPTTSAVRVASIYINGTFQPGSPCSVAVFSS